MYLTSLTEKNNDTIIESLNENHYPNNTSSEVLWAMSFIKKILKQIPETDLKNYTKLNWSMTIPGWPHRTANEDFVLIDRTNQFFEQNGVYAEHPNATTTVSNLGPTRIARYWFPKVETKKSDLLVWYNLVWWLYDDTVETASDLEQKKAIDSTTGDLVDPANEPRSLLRAFNEIGCAFSSMPIEWKKKLHLSQSDWFASHGQELEKVKKYNETGIHPGCEEFLIWRYVNIAAFALAVLTDFAMPSQIDEVRWGGGILTKSELNLIGCAYCKMT